MGMTSEGRDHGAQNPAGHTVSLREIKSTVLGNGLETVIIFLLLEDRCEWTEATAQYQVRGCFYLSAGIILCFVDLAHNWE